MCVYIICDNNLYYHVKFVVEEVKVQTLVWTCYDHDIIIMSYHTFAKLLVVNLKKIATQKKKKTNTKTFEFFLVLESWVQ